MPRKRKLRPDSPGSAFASDSGSTSAPERPPAPPPTAALLVQGGDQRIAIQADSQLNKYGCQPFPAADRIAFASSTASQISAAAFDAADRLRRRFMAAATQPGSSAAAVYRKELIRMRGELLSVCGLAPAPSKTDSKTPDAIFAASGTDAHFLASQLAAAQARRAGRALRVIMVNQEESGSGVSTALSGCSFSSYNALGDCSDLPTGTAIGGTQAGQPGHALIHEVVHVPIRHPDGTLRLPQSIAAAIQALSDAALQAGGDVLLVLIDVSKTGCVSPDPAFARQLQRHAPDRVRVLVDACQFRIETATLRAYLEQDFMVAITGSKFIGGPSFSAALLIPPTLAAPMRAAGVPPQLQRYSAQEEWPPGWGAEQALPSLANPGLLLRWEAALHELKAFQAVPGAAVRKFLLRFNAALQGRLRSDPHFEALTPPVLPARAAGLIPEWDDVQSIHAFTLYRPQQNSPLPRRAMGNAEVARIYRQLQQTRHSDGFIYSVGQPVVCGSAEGVEFSALRLCISAGMAVQACGDPTDTAGDRLIAHAMACLDTIVGLISHSV